MCIWASRARRRLGTNPCKLGQRRDATQHRAEPEQMTAPQIILQPWRGREFPVGNVCQGLETGSGIRKAPSGAETWPRMWEKAMTVRGRDQPQKPRIGGKGENPANHTVPRLGWSRRRKPRKSRGLCQPTWQPEWSLRSLELPKGA